MRSRRYGIQDGRQKKYCLFQCQDDEFVTGDGGVVQWQWCMQQSVGLNVDTGRLQSYNNWHSSFSPNNSLVSQLTFIRTVHCNVNDHENLM